MRALVDYSNPNSLGSRLRRKRFGRIEAMARAVLAKAERCSILDIGGAAAYWRLMRPDLRARCEITILNLEAHRGADPRSAAPEDADIRYLTGDGRDLSQFETGAFDISHSNSVLEHVGLYPDMKRFADETRRVGRRYYVQTPYFWCPVDPHYGAPLVHWLPVSLRVKLLTHVDVGLQRRRESVAEAMSYIEFVNLIDRTVAISLFPDADLEWERFLLWPKSLVLTGPRQSPASG